MKECNLENVKKIQYMMLEELHRVCEENGLAYYLCFGSLIGAIRHNGIIPWDDDIDVVMRREDFEKLIKIYHSDRYKILWGYNCKEHTRSFGRIYDMMTYKKLGRNKALGLSVDINLIYGAPSDNMEMQQHCKKLLKLKKRRRMLNLGMRRLAQLYLWPKHTLTYGLLHKTVINLEQEYAKYPYVEGEEIMISPFLMKFRSECFSKRELHQFESGQFYIPSGYDEFLRKLYGNYMQFPPENERRHNHGRITYTIEDGAL